MKLSKLTRQMVLIGLVVFLIVPVSSLAAVGETEFHWIPNRTPDWYYGDGNFQVTIRNNAFTGWGSWNSYFDIDMGPDFNTEVDQLYVDISPIFSLNKLVGLHLGDPFTDVGLTVQYTGGLINSTYQFIPRSWLCGAVFSFGGGWFDVLDIHLLYKTFSDYKESYDFAYTEPSWGGFYQIYHYDDVWPTMDSFQLTLEWDKTFYHDSYEIFTRGFFKFWRHQWKAVEQYPDVFPGVEYLGPKYLETDSGNRMICQPQIGVRFGGSHQYSVGSEMEFSKLLYREPKEDPDNPSISYGHMSSSFHASLFFSVRY